jgi:hypothetical protein
MLKYVKRFAAKYTHHASFALALISFGAIFGRPLKLVYDESYNPAFYSDPRRQKVVDETEKRRELIKATYAKYQACEDKEEKAKIWKELTTIHENRLLNFYRESTQRKN